LRSTCYARHDHTTVMLEHLAGRHPAAAIARATPNYYAQFMARLGGPSPTISQVASAARVSRSTVSRAFSRPEMLSLETVRNVHAVAQRIGYMPNLVARALSTGRHRAIAVVVPDIANPFFPPVLRGSQGQADAGGFSVFLADSDEDAEREDMLVSRLSTQVAGFILASSRLSKKRILAHASRRPLVLINRDISGLPRVLIDTGSGMTSAVEHLFALGHRRIAYVAGPPNSWSNQQRRSAISATGKRLQMDVSIVQALAPTYEGGIEAAGKVVASNATAAIGFDDLVAQGLIAGLAAKGFAVPTRMSVIGCDNVLAATMYPQLTSVAGHGGEAGRVAVDLLLSLLEARVARDVRYVIGGELVVRATTTKPRSR
jgi:LacI family transcriptional regulator